jgi:DNA-binding PadR family transcriptional regulator
MTRRTNNALPQVSFSILLALSLRARHGYELMQQVEADSNGLVKLGPGALYGTIKQLLDEGLIQEVPSDDKRRRYYSLTDKGLQRLGAELEYFDQTLKVAKQRNLLGDAIWQS